MSIRAKRDFSTTSLSQRPTRRRQVNRSEQLLLPLSPTTDASLHAVSEAQVPAASEIVSNQTNADPDREQVLVGDPDLDPRAVRAANRAIAGLTPPGERQRLMKRQGDLAARQIADELSESEERELQLVRWQLDRIDDALAGEALDVFETVVDEQEHLAKKIGDFVSQLKSTIGKNRRGSR